MGLAKVFAPTQHPTAPAKAFFTSEQAEVRWGRGSSIGGCRGWFGPVAVETSVPELQLTDLRLFGRKVKPEKGLVAHRGVRDLLSFPAHRRRVAANAQ